MRKECDALQREHNIAENDVVTDPKRLRDAVAHIQGMQKEVCCVTVSRDLQFAAREWLKRFGASHPRGARTLRRYARETREGVQIGHRSERGRGRAGTVTRGDLHNVRALQLEAKKAQGVVAELEDKIAAHKRKEDDSVRFSLFFEFFKKKFSAKPWIVPNLGSPISPRRRKKRRSNIASRWPSTRRRRPPHESMLFYLP